MHPSDLFAEYRQLQVQDRRHNSDEARSLRFFAVDVALQEGRTPEEKSEHVA